MKIIYTTLIFLVLFLSFTTAVFSQKKEIDSLENVLFHHKKNDTTKVNLLNSLSFYYSKSDVIKSQENVEEAYNLAKTLNYKKGEAKSYIRFSNIHLNKSELNEAEAFALKALKLYEDLDIQDGINIANVSLGQVAYRNNDADKAMEFYEKVLNVSIENGDLKQQSKMLSDIGTIVYLKGDLDEARILFKKSYALKVQIGEEKSAIKTLNNIGVICINKGRYTEALEYFNKCLSLHREENDKNGIATVTYNMSAVYYELKQYDKTLSFLDESLQLSKELQNRRMIAGCLINKGAVYADLKEFPKALEFMTESLRISEEINDEGELSAGHFQLGDLRFLMGQPEMALQHYATCLEFSESIGSMILICHAQIGLAKTYATLENYPKALEHALKGEKIAEDLELLAQQKLVSEILSTIYSKTGHYKKAFESYQEFKTINDSLFNNENIEKITQLEYEYKYKQALDSASIRELRLTKTVDTTNLNLEKSQRNLLLGVITFLVMILVLVVIIFFLRIRNEKTKTQKIDLEQKLLRSQMTPHFIFNSLSVLQGMILNKEDNKAVFYLSKFSKLLRITLENSRDKTVSLNEELEAVKNYLELQNLEVSQSYDYTILVEDSIDASLFEIPPMLIQPFIENAIEHAFENQKEHRKIDVQLTYLNQELICTIIDNGIGIDAKKETKHTHKKSLATTISSERLKVLSKDFKMKGSIRIEDRQKDNEQGTIVTLVIPYKLDVAV